MAEDWIKMRMELQKHPKTVRMASALSADNFAIIGGLHAVWCLFDTYSEDGELEGYTPPALDSAIGWPGFSAAMIAVKWLEESDNSLKMPRFDNHNGQSAKRRAMDAERKRIARLSAEGADKDGTEKGLEKEKEKEKNKEKKGAPSGAISLQAFLEQCTAAGELAIPEDDPVYGYAESIGLPDDYVHLAWSWFKVARSAKRQKGIRGWRQHFRDAVRGNWPKYWYPVDTGGWALTAVGIQAQRAQA